MNIDIRPAWRVALAAALTAALSACGGGASTTGTIDHAPGAMRAARPGELVAYFSNRIAERSARGMDGTLSKELTDILVTVTAQTDGAASNGFAGTQLQESGVDEDDLIKTDGEFIYAMHPGPYSSTAKLGTSRIRADGSLEEVSRIDLASDFTHSGMYLATSAKRIAVIGEKSWFGVLNASLVAPMPFTRQTSIQLLDTSGAQPSLANSIVIDGGTVSTRMIGNVLYVATTWTPDLSIYPVPANTPKGEVADKLAGLDASQLLPTIRVGAGPAQLLVNERDCFIQPANASLNLQLTTITAIDLASPTFERASRCMVGDSTGLYMSQENVYLATSRDVWFASVDSQAIFPAEVTTDIHKFALQGLDIAYRASGEVAGHLGWDREKMPYRMSEHNGNLRVLTFTGQTGWGMFVPISANGATPASTPSPATLTVLREDGAQRRLTKVSTLPNSKQPGPIGKPGEQVYAVHFAGPRAYVVTFRRVDPLYVIDLADPSNPKAVGELVVPGYSDYLYPLSDGLLLGVGRAASDQGIVQGVQLSLFDVADPSRPSLLDNKKLGDSFSRSALDYSRHGISILKSEGKVRVALPAVVYSMVSPSNGINSTQVQGLARYSIDLGTRKITDRGLFSAPTQNGTPWTDRALQSPTATYYLTGGQVVHIPEL